VNILEKLRAVSKKRSLTSREVRAFVRGDARLLSADELRSIDAAQSTSEEERQRAAARAQLSMLQQ
jgi:hypothetical protein